MKAARYGTSGSQLFPLCGAGGSVRARSAARSVWLGLTLLSLQAHAQTAATVPREVREGAPEDAGRVPQAVVPPIRYRYVLDEDGLRVLAVQGAAEELSAVVPLPGNKTQVVQHGSNLYVACGTEGVAILDARQPGAPVRVGYLAEGEPVSQLTVIGDMLLITLARGEPLAVDLRECAREREHELGRARSLRPDRAERPGLGLLIAGASLFSGAYVASAAWAGFFPKMAIPIAGPLTAMPESAIVLPLTIIDAAAQTAGLAMLIAGAVQLGRSTAAPQRQSGSQYGSLRLTPTMQRGGIGLALSGRF